MLSCLAGNLFWYIGLWFDCFTKIDILVPDIENTSSDPVHVGRYVTFPFFEHCVQLKNCYFLHWTFAWREKKMIRAAFYLSETRDKIRKLTFEVKNFQQQCRIIGRENVIFLQECKRKQDISSFFTSCVWK